MQDRENDPQFYRDLVEKIRFNKRRTIDVSRSERREKSRDAVVDWINSWEANWDMACCWHVSERLRARERGYSETWLQRSLSVYFTKLHKRVFAHLPSRQRPQIPRFITLEHSDGVGWHAHGVMQTPSHMTEYEFSDVLRSTWLEHASWGCAEDFKQHMCWFEPITGNYQHYALKNAINLHDDLPQNYRGFIDDKNSHRP